MDVTIVPLLSIAPEPQKVSERTFKGEAVLVSRFHNAPNAGWSLICSGSAVKLSKNIARVSETMMDSRATIPEVPF